MVQAKRTTNGLSSEFIIHPGETLKEILEERNISQNILAILTGVSPKHVSNILSSKADISVSYAKKLEYVLGIEAQFWINLQSNYDREVFEYEEANSIKKEELVLIKHFKEAIKDYISYGLINENDPEYIIVLKLRSILGVSNLCNISKISLAAAYRIDSKSINKFVLLSWQKMCEIKNKDIEIKNELNIELLKNSIDDIKETMFLEPNEMKKKLKKIFSKCGIIFDIVKNYTGAPVQGYIKELYGNKLLLCMTLRMKYIDVFWFTLMHEIAHILNGDTKNTFIDFDDRNNENEKKADSFAKEALIDPKLYDEFLYENNYSIQSINVFSNRCKIDSSIVVGRLLKEDKIDYKDYNVFRKKYEWNS